MDEWKWWDELDGEDLTKNAWGFPYYDVNAVADFIVENIGNMGDRCLDIGCGPGRLGHELARRFPDTEFHGVDVSAKMLGMSMENAPPNWTSEVNDGMSVPNGVRYTAAYSVTVFQHLPHEVVCRYIQQTYERLRTNGRIIFTYAIGNEEAPRSYQASHELAVSWLEDAGFWDILQPTTPETHPDWHWLVAVK